MEPMRIFAPMGLGLPKRCTFCEEDLAPGLNWVMGWITIAIRETADGSQDPGLGEMWDGEDADLCARSVPACIDGTLACQEALEDILDVCDGEDNDCNRMLQMECMIRCT